ncbi:MAG: hypothetical protein V3T86_16985 [Planctomycetota bacterium]
MKHARIAIAFVLLAGIALAASGCADAGAGEPVKPAKGYEHGIFEFTTIRATHADTETARWITGDEEIDVSSAEALGLELKVPGGAAPSRTIRVRILDHLSSQGWELITRSDVAVAAAAGTGIGERYVFRRKR